MAIRTDDADSLQSVVEDVYKIDQLTSDVNELHSKILAHNRRLGSMGNLLYAIMFEYYASFPSRRDLIYPLSEHPIKK